MRAERIWAALQERAGRRSGRSSSSAMALVYLGYVLAAVAVDARAVAGHGRLRARAARGHRQRASSPTSRASSSWSCSSSWSALAAQAGAPVLRRGRARHRDAADFDADWAQPTYKIVRLGDRRVRPHRRLSLHSGIGVRRVQGGVAVHRHRVLARVVVGDRQHHRRLHDDLPARVQGRRSRQDRRRRRRRDRDAAAGDASPSFKNEEIIIPNSQILSSEVLNYSSLARTQGLILHTEVGIGYETPWRQVEAMLLHGRATHAGPGQRTAARSCCRSSWATSRSPTS